MIQVYRGRAQCTEKENMMYYQYMEGPNINYNLNYWKTIINYKYILVLNFHF